MPMDFENLKNERSEKLENNKKDIEISTKCQWILKIWKIKEVKNYKTIKTYRAINKMPMDLDSHICFIVYA